MADPMFWMAMGGLEPLWDFIPPKCYDTQKNFFRSLFMAVIYGPGSNASDVVLFPLRLISTQEADCRDAQISVFNLPGVAQVIAGRLLRWPGVMLCWKEV